jgi:hypothetical protein
MGEVGKETFSLRKVCRMFFIGWLVGVRYWEKWGGITYPGRNSRSRVGGGGERDEEDGEFSLFRSFELSCTSRFGRLLCLVFELLNSMNLIQERVLVLNPKWALREDRK